jgi:hypothetical protein
VFVLLTLLQLLLEKVNDLRTSNAEKQVRDLVLTAALYTLCDWIVSGDEAVVVSGRV